MMEEVLLIGDVKVFKQPVVMKCFGLGSCIGLFVKDRLTGVSGGAHIFLPSTMPSSKDIDHNASVLSLLEKMKHYGSDLTCLRAKLTGGANVLGQGFDIGSLNIQSVIDQLILHKVFIAAKDLGGNVSRTARFDVATESLSIKALETKRTIII